MGSHESASTSHESVLLLGHVGSLSGNERRRRTKREGKGRERLQVGARIRAESLRSEYDGAASNAGFLLGKAEVPCSLVGILHPKNLRALCAPHSRNRSPGTMRGCSLAQRYLVLSLPRADVSLVLTDWLVEYLPRVVRRTKVNTCRAKSLDRESSFCDPSVGT